MKKFLSIILAIFMMVAAFAVEPSKLSQLKGVDVQRIEQAEDPNAEMHDQLEKLAVGLYKKIDYMEDDGQDYKKWLHFRVSTKEFVYCYIVKYDDGSFYLVMEYKNEERFFSSRILDSELYVNEDGDPLFNDAPGIAITFYTKAGPVTILDDVDSPNDYFIFD